MIEVLRNVPLAPKTTFRTGGLASCFAVASSLDDIREAVQYSKEHDLALFVLGGGSNMLVSDEGFEGLVLEIALKGIEWQDADGRAIVAAGESWDGFVKEACLRGWYGIENLSGIPGSVGGTPIQNVGAYGVEVKDVIEWVEAFDTETGAVRRFSNAECAFSYRDSFFKTEEGKRYIVIAVAFSLTKQKHLRLAYRDLKEYFKDRGEPSLLEVREAVLSIRAQKFPDLTRFGTAGSFFKNPIITESEFERLRALFPEMPSYPMGGKMVKLPIAWCIERFGWKGKREGSVGTFDNQPLVIVNYGGATANEIRAFTKKISDDVFARTNIRLDPEVRSL